VTTRIENVGRNRHQVRCTVCGPIDDGSDLDVLRHIQERHDGICPEKKAK
jgi:hypothetical protein